MKYTRSALLIAAAALSLTVMSACASEDKDAPESAQSEIAAADRHEAETEEEVTESEAGVADENGFVDGVRDCGRETVTVELKAVDSPATLSVYCPEGWVQKDLGFNSVWMQSGTDDNTAQRIVVKALNKEEGEPLDGMPVDFTVGDLEFTGTVDDGAYDVRAERDGWYYTVWFNRGLEPGDLTMEEVLSSVKVE